MQPSLFRLQTRINAILNGLYGDWLAERGNPLAVPMQFIHDGSWLHLDKPEVTSPQSTLIVLIHGLMGSESIWEYPKQPGHTYATDLASVLPATPLCLRYNTGRAILANGSDLNAAMEKLIARWPLPVERLILVGHSMGGLLIRSACHQALESGHEWVNRVRQCVYIGSPHDGSWLAKSAEKTAGLMRKMPRDYVRVVGEVVDSRSQGIANLGRGGVSNDTEHPLLHSAQHYTISGSLSNHRLNPAKAIVGDGLVHEASASSSHSPELHWTDRAAFDGVGHVRLAHHSAVSQQLVRWLL